jgi:tetratricopeptide (TPR) repeat protein
VIDDVSPGGDPDGAIAFARYQVALYERNYDAAERALASTPVAQFEVIQHTMAPKTYFEACLALARGDAERAHSLFQSVLPAAEAMVKEHPEIASRHAYLGLIYAYLGRKEDAVREGRQAVELPPEATDAADGPPIQIVLATIYARTGEFDLALPLIERLLTTPSGIMFADLRTWWEWDPLRKDPRFQKIVAGPEPKVIYQ